MTESILSHIADDTRLSVPYLQKVVRTASHRYKTYFIDKRKIGEKREIAQPARELKLLQYWVIERVLDRLPIHMSAYGYRRGTGIGEMASLHVSGNYILRMDFSDFFPSITSQDVKELLQSNMYRLPWELDSYDQEVLCRILCRHGRLTIGSPSSPTLSNIVMFSIDKKLYELCEASDVVYSRYADDLVFSCKRPNVLRNIERSVCDLVNEAEVPRLKINHEKTIHTSRKHRQMVTGLVVTPERKVSIGRATKREVKLKCHLFKQGKLSESEAESLVGYLAYVWSVEPSFLLSLQEKFGQSIIDDIQSTLGSK